MKVPFFQPSFSEAEENAVLETLRSFWLTQGPKTFQFEKDFSKKIDNLNSIAVNSCTSGLFLLLYTLNLQFGDEIITTPYTYAATSNVILHHRAKPIFVDIDPKTLNISPKEIEKKITNQTKAIIVVHVGGNVCQMDEILAIAREKNIPVIEDAAHSVETRFNGKACGSETYGAAFSFYPNKNLVSAEGGMISTNNEKLAQRLTSLRNQGRNLVAESSGFKQYDILEPGFKMNMNDLQAAIASVQLQKLDENWKKREKLVNRYQNLLKTDSVEFIRTTKNSRPAHHLMMLKLNLQSLKISRDEFAQEMEKNGVGVSVHYKPIHLFSYYSKNLGTKIGDFPNVEKVGESILSLPLFPDLRFEQQDYVLETFSNLIKKYSR